MHPVDALLHDARQLLGTLTPATLTVITTPEPPTATGWEAGSADTAHATTSDLHRQLTHLRQLHTAARAVLDHAAELTRTAHIQLHSIETAWTADQNTATANPDGQAALLHASQQHITAITDLVRATADQFQGAAHELAAITAQL